ncbi:MAG: hypothetical protein ABI664_06415 [bacterium]
MPELLHLVDAAAVHPDFKREFLEFVRGGAASRIELEGYTPRVKVERVLMQLFHAQPELSVERVRLRARSGCSDFTGELVAVTSDNEEHKFSFIWCCSWKAQQEGWKDCFGFWDQARAAREFGWQCFQKWEPVS